MRDNKALNNKAKNEIAAPLDYVERKRASA